VNLKILKRLREFEEIKSQGKAVEVTVNNKRKTLKTFVWISSKNWASTKPIPTQGKSACYEAPSIPE
jgi:hypothetical protein